MIRLILPAYNEAANLPSLASDISRVLQNEPFRLFAVNDGSADATGAALANLATRYPLTVLTHPVNEGVGAAFRNGFRLALDGAADSDIIVLMESDGTSTPALLPAMLSRIRAGAQVVIASRYQTGGGYANFPWQRLLLSRGANALFRLVFPIPGVRDYTIFYRAYRAGPLRAAAKHYGESLIESPTFLANAEVLLKLRPFAHRVEEVPLLYDYGKKKGRSGMKVWKNLKSYLIFVARNI